MIEERFADRLFAFWLAIAATTLACVGGEDGGRARDTGDTRRPEMTTFGRDTASALVYQPVELVVESQEPRKVTLHLIVLQDPTPAQKGVTLRAVLDSLGRADSTLAAARAVLYTGRPGSAGVDFVADGWAEWVPPEGFEAAGARSQRRTYRVFVFHDDPGWTEANEAAPEEGRSDD